MNLNKRRLTFILLLCIGCRLAFFGAVHPWIPEIERDVVLRGDSQYYDKLANTFLESHRFAYSNTGRPDALRTPLYPLFVAGVYSLFGHAPWIVLLFQVILDSLSCLLLAITLARLVAPRVALIAALFYAVDPFLILYSSEFLSEILFVFFLVCAFYILSTGISAGSEKWRALGYSLGGLVLGLATLVRPVSRYVPVFLVIFLLSRYRSAPRAALRYAVLALALFVLALTPWLIRNAEVFGNPFISTFDSYNLLVLNVVPLEREKRGLDSGTVKQQLLSEADSMMAAEGKNPEGWNQLERAAYWRRLAIRYIEANPVGFARFYFLGVIQSFWNLGTSEFARVLRIQLTPFDIKAYSNITKLARGFLKAKGTRGFVIAALAFPFLLISYIGMAVGLVVSWKRYDRGVLLLCLLFALYFVLITGIAGLARFRLPSIPFYLAFVGIGFDYLFERRTTRTPRGHR